MNTKICPICGLEQDRQPLDCNRCGWDFSPMLGTPDQVQALLNERIDRARYSWRQIRYNPEIIPKLDRDPFETPEEFCIRLGERPWYVGEGELCKAEYNIKTGNFPLGIQSPRIWAKPWVSAAGSYSLRLPRDRARDLYQRGSIWPLYGRLAVNGSMVSLASLVLLAPEGELQVKTEVIRVQASGTHNVTAVAKTDPRITGSYHDLGNGTLLDTRTGLQWMRCALGQQWDGQTCVGEAGMWIWVDLSASVESFNNLSGCGGLRDWRIPTIDELKTLIDDSNSLQAIAWEAFPKTSRGRFWSSSPCVGNSNDAWSADFGNNYVFCSSKNYQRYVRLVRHGK